jgi:hypothetical protein
MNAMARILVLACCAGLFVSFGHAEDKPPKTEAKKDAPTPKPLSDAVKKGLEYLVNQQHESGGWGQGGGWRNSTQGNGRVEGANVKDPPDVGNTCIAVLALIRAGNTPKEGPYAKNVAKGIDFLCNTVEKADKDSLWVTDVKGTQIQSKIGQYVDTFLASMVLSEIKGKMDTAKSEERLVVALDKVVTKIEKHQGADGTFAGNNGWASVLSQGLANKGLNRARQAGAKVSDEAIAKVEKQVAANFDGKTGEFRGGGGVGGAAPAAGLGRAVEAVEAPFRGGNRTESAAAPAGIGSDAGVAIYAQSAQLASGQEVANTLREERKKAEEVLTKKDAKESDRDQARATLKRVADVEKLQDQATKTVVNRLNNKEFVAGFGSNGGEEFLSFMNISETLYAKGGEEWTKWDKSICENLGRIQDKDGSWSGHHCITGKTFCTASALLTMMADRAPMPTAKK